MVKFKITDIRYAIENCDIVEYLNDKYGVTEDDYTEEELCDGYHEIRDRLPNEVVVELDYTTEEIQEMEEHPMDELDELVSDALTDLTGWLNYGFNYQRIYNVVIRKIDDEDVLISVPADNNKDAYDQALLIYAQYNLDAAIVSDEEREEFDGEVLA